MKSALFIILLAGWVVWGFRWMIGSPQADMAYPCAASLRFPPSAAAPANNSGLGEPPLKEHTGGGNALFRRFCYSSGFISTVR